LLPKVTNNYFTERSGVIAVEKIVNGMRCIWRETPNADVGIDGQIEYVDSAGNATGRLVAVQVKSGKSYIPEDGDLIQIYPEEKHRQYWENFPLPVLLVVYDPETDTAYWQDARRILRSERKTAHIEVPRDQVLELAQRERLFESCGAFGLPILSEHEVLAYMISTWTENASFPLSYAEILFNGLTDIGRKVFFSIGLCAEIAEFNQEQGESGLMLGLGLGGAEYEFIDQYVQFIVSQALVVFDYSDYLIDLRDRDMVSTFLVPLTARGRNVRDLARELGGGSNPYELTECGVEMAMGPTWHLRLEANRAVVSRLRASHYRRKK
jgi:hypothetical protein